MNVHLARATVGAAVLGGAGAGTMHGTDNRKLGRTTAAGRPERALWIGSVSAAFLAGPSLTKLPAGMDPNGHAAGFRGALKSGAATIAVIGASIIAEHVASGD